MCTHAHTPTPTQGNSNSHGTLPQQWHYVITDNQHGEERGAMVYGWKHN